ncbi:WD40/YVTN/BNR-like repeat-containing protein [Falsibacillus pallidus]|uniref:WD40/YVTN/BNR-like repeat-containing protein n=1 Tax=Falsibacillus pallidus TaxID=493781 RepID=UPI003D959A91
MDKNRFKKSVDIYISSNPVLNKEEKETIKQKLNQLSMEMDEKGVKRKIRNPLQSKLRLLLIPILIFFALGIVFLETKSLMDESASKNNHNSIVKSQSGDKNISIVKKSYYHLLDLKMINGQVGWAVNDQGGIIRTTDAWKNYKDVSPSNFPIENAQNKYVFINEHEARVFVWLNQVGKFKAYSTKDGGETWGDLNVENIKGWGFQDVQFNDENHGLIYTSQNNEAAGILPYKLYRTKDGGQSWKECGLQGLSNSTSKWVSISDEQTIWSLGQNVKKGTDYFDPSTTMLYKSTNNGESWNPVNLLKTEKDTEIDYLRPQFFGKEGIMTAIQVPKSVQGDSAKLTIFHFYKNAKWVKVRDMEIPFKRYSEEIFPLFQKENINVFFSDINHGWLASNNHIYRTEDGGKTWTELKDNGKFPTLNFQFVSTSSGFGFTDLSLFKTLDGGASWEAISFSSKKNK